MYRSMTRFCIVLLLFPVVLATSQPLQFKKIATNTNASFRGLSVVDNHTAWVSGTKGTVGRTTDGGKTWSFQRIPGFEELDFRSLYAFNGERAIIANVGSPAHILITSDGGKSWKPVYTNNHQDAFLDGIDFWDKKNGLIYGDPIEGKMFLLRTNDGGVTWTPTKESPKLETGEASFAASGTGIRCTKKRLVTICTGGKVSRLWTSDNLGANWTSLQTPIVQGESTTGVFSFVQHNGILHIVGGDYKNMSMNRNHNFYSTDGGNHWATPATPIRGYRECIEAIQEKILISTGPSGTDVSYDNGMNWKAVSDDTGMHVVRKARDGSLVIVAGSDGQIFLVEALLQE